MMHLLFSEAAKIPWWAWVLFGYAVGFLMTNWLLSWHAEEKEKDNQRLQILLAETRDELRQTNKVLEMTR
jgi:hypothetical protein